MKNSNIIIFLFILLFSFSLSSCYFFLKEKSYECCEACLIEDYDSEIDYGNYIYVCHGDDDCAETCEAKCCEY